MKRYPPAGGWMRSFLFRIHRGVAGAIPPCLLPRAGRTWRVACGLVVKASEDASRRAAESTPERCFDAIAPSLFFTGRTKTNPERNGFPRAVLHEVLRWNPTGLGLIIAGPSGAGKSRILWELLRRLIVVDRLDVEILQGGDFRQRLVEAYRAERSETVLAR